MSFTSKILLYGRNAGAFLNHFSTVLISFIYLSAEKSHTLNDNGRMEAGVTIISMPPNEYLVVVINMTQHFQEEKFI